MRKLAGLLFLLGILTGCTPATQPIPTAIPADTSIAAATALPPAGPAFTESVAISTLPAPADDFFTQMGITLPTPACAGLTQAQTAGPYYTPDTPERHSLLEEGLPGGRLILVGYVLDEDCQALSNAWLDFWQAGADGEYDNAAYGLRGHQFTDAQGRYYLETVLPGEYSSRPIEHIHVKVRAEGGEEVTSQLYFPDQPVAGLTVTIEDRGDYLLGYFNFVVPR